MHEITTHDTSVGMAALETGDTNYKLISDPVEILYEAAADAAFKANSAMLVP